MSYPLDLSKETFRRNRLEYEEMKRRLIETELKLQSLNKLEDAEIESITSLTSSISGKLASGPSMKSRENKGVGSEPDDLESVPSAISTMPDSYTGFARCEIPSSTPSRNEPNQNQSNTTIFNKNGFESDSSSSSMPQSAYDMKLIRQNQRLLSEVERLVREVHASNQKNTELMKAAEKVKAVSDFEDKIDELNAEINAQDKALREAEKHIDEGQRRNSELQKRLESTESEITELESELTEERRFKKELEIQRDEALYNFVEAQESLEDYQKRTKEKIKKTQDNEDELRELLSTVTQERDDILEQLSDIVMTLASQEAQINRLLNDVSSEDAKNQEMGQKNSQLQHQLDLLTSQLNDFEKGRQEVKEVKKDNYFLESELSEHRVMAQDVKALLQMLQMSHGVGLQNDSGNFSIHTATSCSVKSGRETDRSEGASLAVELNCNNNGLGCESQANMMCEMRNLVTNMDSEIQRLRADLKQRDADERTYSNLREELKILMDRVECGICRNQELECLVSSLQEDKKNSLKKVEEALSCLEERERAIQCLETRLNERNCQVVCLQEDVDEKAHRISCLEAEMRELHKRLSAIHGESGSDAFALKEALNRVSELENLLYCKNKSLEDFQNKLQKSLKDYRLLKADQDKQIECLNSSLMECQNQITVLSCENESLKQKLNSCNKVCEEMRKSNRAKDDKIGELENALDELKFAKKEMEDELNKQLINYQDCLKSCQDQVKELEHALLVCHNEVANHIKTMEDIRVHFQCELEQRDNCIKKLKEDLRRTVEELKCKMEDNAALEKALGENKNKLQQMCCQLKESENTEHCLMEKVKDLEKQLVKEKTACMKESEELDRRLAQCNNNMAVAGNEINQLKLAIEEKNGMIDNLQIEKGSICRDLKKCSDDLCACQERCGKMERDNQELCRQLQQKMECIRDLENLVHQKEQELKCLGQCLEELQNRENSSPIEHLEAQLKDMQCQLEKCKDDFKCKSAMLCECEEAYRNNMLLLNDKEDQINMLKCQLDTLNNKFKERVSRVEELERCIESLHKDMERRMQRVDEQLRKYENELTDKTKELATMEECFKLCQFNLTEKANEMCQLDQKNQKLCAELQSASCNLKELEDVKDNLNCALNEKRVEVSELTQELRICREQMQNQHQELVETRQCLSGCQRETDKLRRETEDMRAIIEVKECETSRLMEEKNCLQGKLAQTTCRLESEICQLQQQMADMKCRLEKELDYLRNYISQVEGTNSNLMQKLSCSQRQLMQVEKCCHQKLDSLNRDVEDLKTKLCLREDELQSCRECINIKESEIMRLKLRLCNAEKPCKPNCNRPKESSLPGCNTIACNNSNSNNNNQEVKDLSLVKNDMIISVMESTSLKAMSVTGGQESAFENEDDIKEWTSRDDNFLSAYDKSQSENEAGFSPNKLLFDDLDQLPELHSPNSERDSTGTHHSIGVSEVQERLRTNQLKQKEIERQLQSLEEGVELLQDVGQEDKEEKRH